MFGMRRVYFANSKRNARERSWKSSVMWTVFHWWRIILEFTSCQIFGRNFRNSRQKPKGRRWYFDDKVLAASLPKRSPKSYNLPRTLLPLPSRRSLQSLLNTVPVRMLMCLVQFKSLCWKCLVEINIVVSCLTKCQSERSYITVCSLAVLSVLRIAEVRARHAKLQIIQDYWFFILDSFNVR
jgi:hypothetical protein